MLSFSFPPWYPGVMTAIVSPGYLLYLILLAGLCVYGFKRLSQLKEGYRYLTYLALVITISESLSRLFAWLIDSSLPVYHILIPCQIILYQLIFRSLIKDVKIKRIALYFGIAAFITTISFSLNTGILAFPSLNISVLSLYIISLSLYLFYQLVQNPTEESLFRIADFWFALGNLVFYAGAFMIFTLLHVLFIKDFNRPRYIFDIILYLNYFLYASYVVSIYFGTRKFKVLNEQFS